MRPRRSTSSLLSDAASTALRHARRVVVAVVGVTLLLVGLALLFLPGPGTLLLLLGLGVLGAEFAWARVWIKRLQRGARELRDGTARAVQRIRGREGAPASSAPGADADQGSEIRRTQTLR